MDRTPPRTLISSITILVTVVVVIALVVFVISLAMGSVPSWALALLIGSFIALVIIRAIAMARYGYPPYDFSQLYERNKRSKEKK